MAGGQEGETLRFRKDFGLPIVSHGATQEVLVPRENRRGEEEVAEVRLRIKTS